MNHFPIDRITGKPLVYGGAHEGDSVLDPMSVMPALKQSGQAKWAEDEPFISCVPDQFTVNWSESLEQMHEESSRSHFIEVWTRRAMLARLVGLPAAPTIVDVGCSSGYMLEQLRTVLPDAKLVGVDLVASGLRKAHEHVPDAFLLQADVCELPLDDACIDGVVCANLLEHVGRDEQALTEIYRILRPGARAVIVVPVSPGNYDCYDRLLGHERRYARGELARKAAMAGFEVLQDIHLGAPLYPAFWIVKQRNRRRHEQLTGRALEQKVMSDMERTGDSALGRLACSLEELLLLAGVALPFGIRGLSVLERPRARA
jgi:SAM-dependent methyltransferase